MRGIMEKRKKGGGNTGKAQKEDAQLKKVLGELTSAIKEFLEATTANQRRLAAAKEKQSEALMKIAEVMPMYIRGWSGTGQKLPKKQKISKEKKKTIDLVIRLRGEGMTYEEIAAHLEENKVTTLSGRGHWHAQTIHRLCTYFYA